MIIDDAIDRTIPSVGHLEQRIMARMGKGRIGPRPAQQQVP